MLHTTAVHVPWTDEQVANLNDFQQSGHFHPYTCTCEAPDRVLVATTMGWKCPNDKCGHTQLTAPEYMADGTALANARQTWADIFEKWEQNRAAQTK